MSEYRRDTGAESTDHDSGPGESPAPALDGQIAVPVGALAATHAAYPASGHPAAESEVLPPTAAEPGADQTGLEPGATTLSGLIAALRSENTKLSGMLIKIAAGLISESNTSWHLRRENRRLMEEIRHSKTRNLQLEEENKRLRYAATHDELTGLLNLAGFNQCLTNMPHPEVALYLDATNFKAVNDTINHDRGDEVLVAFAELMSLAVREDDIVARIGGDEFVIILTSEDGVSEEKLHAHAEAVRRRIGASVGTFLMHNPDVDQARLDLAIGIAMCKAGMSAKQLKAAAEKSMLRHKAEQHSRKGSYRSSAS